MNIAHVYQTFIRATPDEVWTAITDPEWTRRWFHGTAAEAPFVEGARYRTTTTDGRPAVEGVIEELDPPHRLVQTWRVLYDASMAEEPPSRVEWQIDDVGDRLTRVRLVHGDLGRSPLTWASVKDGWAWVLDSLKSSVETGDGLPPWTVRGDDPADVDTAGDWHRAQGVEANNAVWGFVDRTDRTAADDEAMLRAAYASAFHWSQATGRGPANEARASYMIAKAHLLAGHPRLSLEAADRCLAACAEHGLVDFDLAYAHEARARALRALGEDAAASTAWSAAVSVSIADPEDRAILDADLAVPL